MISINALFVTPRDVPVPDGGVKITNFTSSGTWTKDARTKYIGVYGWNGGHGGGGGSITTVGPGGSGGGAGSCFYYEAPATFFGETEEVIVGKGGAGGLHKLSGSKGTYSAFGKIICPVDGTAGASNSAGGTSGKMYIGSFGTPLVGITGGAASYWEGGTPSNSGTSANKLIIGAPGGGGGGNPGDGTSYYGGTGGAIVSIDDSTVILAGGARGGISGYNRSGSPGNNAPTSGGIICGGSGGGGGGANWDVSYGDYHAAGGNGGFPGGGAGGGGALNRGNVTQINGGVGGDGLVIVVEYFE
jgi:hypothetical protein